ncbi:hypothetical protein [Streptomyces virginiae]|uniref:hypothetical protein n=1 Tax=Streptomyces virginiae TaxID=1961 RepID=UPI0022599515|nr:hypothetical protein [Streptomyces virginiae]MCX5278191.1 hypothetical protein [Streptomyces virginiae]
MSEDRPESLNQFGVTRRRGLDDLLVDVGDDLVAEEGVPAGTTGQGDPPSVMARLRHSRASGRSAGQEALRIHLWPVRDVEGAGMAAPAREAVTATSMPAAPEAPVKARDMAPPGFHRALTAHLAVPRAQHVSSGVTEAIERQNRAMRELSRRAFPEADVVPDDAPAPIEQARLQRRRQAAVTKAAALRRARAERAGRTVPDLSHAPQAAGEVA